MPYIIAEPCTDVKDKACVEACPVSIDPLSIIMDMRRYLVMEESCVEGDDVKVFIEYGMLTEQKFFDKAKDFNYDGLNPAERNG